MKLRFKKTGEVVELEPLEIFNANGNLNLGDARYNSIKDFVADWEDAPEEPKWYWFIENDGEVNSISLSDDSAEGIAGSKEIGNYFSSREEAEKAVERLRAWKRLKDKGFRFEGFDGRGRGIRSEIEIYADIENPGDYANDLDLLFSEVKNGRRF